MGCGEGIALHYINPVQYVGVDTSFSRLRFASRLYEDLNFVQADGTCLPFDSGKFDLVFCNGTIHHLSKQGAFSMIQEMGRVCKKGGWVAVIEPNAYNPSSLLLALIRKPERGIFHCKAKLFLGYFKEVGMSEDIKLKYDGTFAPISVLTHFFKRGGFIKAPWFNELWRRIDHIVNRIVPKRFWSNIIMMAKK